MKSVRLAALAVSGLLLAACGAAEQAGAAMPAVTPAPPPCPETTATPASGRPAVLASTTGSWFGTADLWVGLPERSATVEGDALVLKFPWVTLDGEEPTAELGAPEVSAARPGTPAPVPAAIAEYARTFGTGDLAFWPATIEFPAPGCWTVTGRLADTTVEFVVDVAPP